MTLNTATPAFVETLRSELPEGCLRAPSPSYLEEPRGRWAGQAGAVALPRSVEEVSQIVSACHRARVGVVPYGGGTGLVGGQILSDGLAPLLLSLERMKRVRAVLPEENVAIVEAGVTLAQAQEAAEEAGRLFPLSIASQGTAQIGGNLAANAGGVNVLRYGNARDLCLGLEAVLADGSIWNGLTRLRKDNTGYDLRNLLIGSEGSLGVITAATLKLSPRPAGQGTALLAVTDPRAALALLALARDEVGEAVSSFELMHRMGFDFLAETHPELRPPFDALPEWCVLIELGLARGRDPEAALAAIYEAGHAAGLVHDGVIAQSGSQRAALWSLRETIPAANRVIGSVSSHDISLPLGAIPEFVDIAPGHIAAIDQFRINCFGHLGDGNLHYNVFPMSGKSRADHEHQRDAVKRAVHDLVHQMGGSVSAEHGVGRLKVDDLERYGDPTRLAAMRAIKTALDPAGILNPGVILRA